MTISDMKLKVQTYVEVNPPIQNSKILKYKRKLSDKFIILWN
mgnify:CR=1 FL=1